LSEGQGGKVKMPLVSVIMSSYNYERYISRAIESVLSQTFADFELLIIDDGSRDSSRDIIQRYSRQDSRIRYIFHGSNTGIAKVYNEGIQASKGKFIAFIDSDDLWARDKLQKQIDILKDDENLVVWSEGEIINKDDEPVGTRFTQLHKATGKRKTGYVFNELVKGNFVFLSSAIFRKDNLDSIRFNEDIRHLNDFVFFLDLSRRYDFCFIDEPLAKYRIHGGNISLKKMEIWNEDGIQANEYILAKYGADLSRKLRSRLLCVSALLYTRTGRFRESFRCMYEGIKTYPLNVYYLMILPVSMAKYRLQETFINRWDTYRQLAKTN